MMIMAMIQSAGEANKKRTPARGRKDNYNNLEVVEMKVWYGGPGQLENLRDVEAGLLREDSGEKEEDDKEEVKTMMAMVFLMVELVKMVMVMVGLVKMVMVMI